MCVVNVFVFIIDTGVVNCDVSFWCCASCCIACVVVVVCVYVNMLCVCVLLCDVLYVIECLFCMIVLMQFGVLDVCLSVRDCLCTCDVACVYVLCCVMCCWVCRLCCMCAPDWL